MSQNILTERVESMPAPDVMPIENAQALQGIKKVKKKAARLPFEVSGISAQEEKSWVALYVTFEDHEDDYLWYLSMHDCGFRNEKLIDRFKCTPESLALKLSELVECAWNNVREKVPSECLELFGPGDESGVESHLLDKDNPHGARLCLAPLEVAGVNQYKDRRRILGWIDRGLKKHFPSITAMHTIKDHEWSGSNTDSLFTRGLTQAVALREAREMQHVVSTSLEKKVKNTSRL